MKKTITLIILFFFALTVAGLANMGPTECCCCQLMPGHATVEGMHACGSTRPCTHCDVADNNTPFEPAAETAVTGQISVTDHAPVYAWVPCWEANPQNPATSFSSHLMKKPTIPKLPVYLSVSSFLI